MTTEDPSIADTTMVALSRPEIPGPLVNRGNIVDTMERIFAQGLEVVCVEGDEGSGKTTLLFQAAMRFGRNCCYVYLHPASAFGQHPSTVRLDICNQIHWIMHGVTLPTTAQVDDALFNQRLFELRRKVARDKQEFYFVLDGLEGIPDEKRSAKSEILDLLPFGTARLRFIFSGNADSVLGPRKSKLRVKSLPLNAFSLHETREYFADAGIDETETRELQNTFKGVPGHLATARRLITSGVPIQALLEEPEFKELLSLEWSRSLSSLDLPLDCIALVAFARAPLDCAEIAQISGIAQTKVREGLSGLTFLSVSDKGLVSFVSQRLQRYAQSQLRHLEARCLDAHTTFLLAEPHSPRALALVPKFLESLNRPSQLLEYLDNSYFVASLEKLRNISYLREAGSRAVSSALSLRSSETLRLSVLLSSFSSLVSITADRSEIEVLLALGEYEKATAIANSAPLVEDRLLLLATIARTKKQAGLEPEPALLDQLVQVHTGTDFRKVPGDKTIEIAKELFSVNPELALSLVDESAASSRREDAPSWRLRQFSMAAMTASPRDSVTGVAGTLTEKLGARSPKTLVSALTVFLAPISAAQVIGELKHVAKPSDRVAILREWCRIHYRRVDAIEVVESALNLALRHADIATSAALFRDLARPLPHAKDVDRVHRIVDLLDGQRALIEQLGPWEEAAHLQLLVAETLFSMDSDLGIARLVDIYLDIANSVRDLEARSAVLASFCSLLVRVDPDGAKLRQEGLRDLVETELHSSIDTLLNHTADHSRVFRDVLSALVTGVPEQALNLARRLNIRPRRDRAFLLVVRDTLAFQTDLATISSALSAIDEIVSPRNRDRALASLVSHVGGAIEARKLPVDAVDLQSALNRIAGAAQRFRSSLLAIKSVASLNDASHDDLVHSLCAICDAALDAIDRPWLRVTLAFEAAAELAKALPEKARDLYASANAARHTLPIQSEDAAQLVFNLTNLALSAFRGLLASTQATDKDERVIEALIVLFPDHGAQAVLWGNLAHAYFSHGRTEKGKEVVFRNVKPNIDAISPGNTLRRCEVIEGCAAILWRANRETALDMFEAIPQPYRDAAYHTVLRSLLRSVGPDEPFESNQAHIYVFDYDTAISALALIAKIEDDGGVFWTTLDICRSVEHRARQGDFSREQVLEIHRRIREAILPKFPTKTFITHAGYQVLTELWLNRLIRARATPPRLLVQAASIPNSADAGFVLSHACDAMLPKEHALRALALRDARHIIEGIPNRLERADRLESLATVALQHEPFLTRELVRKAFDETLAERESRGDRDNDIQDIRDGLIDLAYRIDKDFAESLVTLLSDDPAKERARTKCSQQVSKIAMMKALLNEKAPFECKADEDLDNLPSAAWRAVGQLNSGAAGPIHFMRAYEVAHLASQIDFDDAYPAYLFTVENLVRMYSTTDQATTYIRPAFDGLVEVTNSFHSALRIVSHIPLSVTSTELGERGTSVVVRVGERNAALIFLKDWFATARSDSLVICDPYFGPEEMWLLQMAAQYSPGIQILVLASEGHLAELGIPKPWDEYFRASWKAKISASQDPPDTQLVIAGVAPSGQAPFHDRWILGDNGGIRLGASLNSLGRKLSELSILGKDETLLRRGEIEPYVSQRQRHHMGNRVRYVSFTL